MLAPPQHNHEYVDFFGKHCLALSCLIDLPAQEQQCYMISGFVIFVHKRCLFITAGHVLEKVLDDVDKVKKAGGKITGWAINDNLSPSAKYKHNIPFGYEEAPKFFRHDKEDGVDCAVITLRHEYYELIQKNGVVPLGEDAWKIDDLYNFEAYFLCGIPSESVAYTPNNQKFTANPYLLEIIPTDNPPQDLRKATPRFYGKIADEVDNAPNRIEGMSGGPIFGLRRNSEGEPEHRVIAIQSSWSSKSRVIAAYPLRPFCEWIDEQISQAGQEDKS